MTQSKIKFLLALMKNMNVNEVVPSENMPTTSFLMDIFGDKLENLTEDAIVNKRIWVFGYGSILWKTGFPFRSKRIGYIKGYSRKFWQGNTTHRGSSDKPGRVATVVPQSNKEKNQVWGVAYELLGESMVREAMSQLYSRECHLGGYTMQQEEFHTKQCNCQPISVLVFRATESSKYYLGPASESQLALQITNCQGPSGHNIEYVVLLALFLQRHIPEDQDDHISSLHKNIHEILLHRGEKICDYVRMHLLPDCGKDLFNNCQNCSSARNQTFVSQMNCDLQLEENIAMSL